MNRLRRAWLIAQIIGGLRLSALGEFWAALALRRLGKLSERSRHD